MFVVSRWRPVFIERSLIWPSAAFLLLLGAGSILSSFVTKLWHIFVSAGVLMAVGAGGAAMSTGSSVVARWFDKHRGVAMGLAAGGMSAGQLIVIPLATALTISYGWRSSFLWLGVGLIALVVPIGAWLIRNTPEEQGVRPLGAEGGRGRRVGIGLHA